MEVISTDANLSEEFQFKVTEDGVVHIWHRGDKMPPEARRDVCPVCLKGRGVIQKLQREKTEFAGKKGEVHRDYVCPVCGYRGLPVRRQKRYLTRGTLKEPER